MQKKGSELDALLLFSILGVLLVVVFAFAPIIAQLSNIQENTFFEKNFLVADMANVIDALYASPGAMAVVYDKDTQWFSFNFAKDKVEVWDSATATQFRSSFPLLTDGNVVINELSLTPSFEGTASKDSLEIPVKPLFARIQDGIFIQDQRASLGFSFDTLSCSQDDLPTFSTLLVDAAHGGEDEGNIEGEKKEKDLVSSLAGSVASLLAVDDSVTVSFSRNGFEGEDRDSRKTFSDEQVTDFDAVLSIHIQKGQEASNTLKAYYLANATPDVQKASRALGCSILKNVIQQNSLNFNGFSLIPLQDGYFEDLEDEESTPFYLTPTVPGILLEVGNLASAESVVMLTETRLLSALAGSIAGGMS
ncbi:MAG: N-acetylmuramoyl-L-alanine amidase [Nanoarchaeota archaeon]|nr:N-acetylmuramoyl-L-alanine amidase [Nanoarchaeota archaeon]